MIKRILLLTLILTGLSIEVGYLSYRLGKWVAHYEDSWMHLGGNCAG